MSAGEAGGDALVLAVPSKGRLQENAAAFFARAGLSVVQERGARDYRGALEGLGGVEVAFLSASEIVGQLAGGAIHLGVTGEDLVRESIAAADAKVELLTPLGFGNADVVVAVPQAWIDVRTMADLEDVAVHFRARHGRRIRVATKYVNLTRRFFAGHGIADYRIVESLGATEGAPATGAAELIVDITTTGATLASNALKRLADGLILRSEANLVASLQARWTDRARQAAQTILGRIAAEEEARTSREVRALMPTGIDGLFDEARSRFGAHPPFGRTDDAAGTPLTLHCAREKAADLADWLVAGGAQCVTVGALDYVFSAQNRLYERLARRLAPASLAPVPT
ncbi:MAG: ATP phosphoribosyltransferase [Methylobacteriaceae bacterium]|nr:ATP phosphoribosyltransferase [Methylobacteriaceae bacterium]